MKYCNCLKGDKLFGVDISKACHLHDQLCGERGSYNPLGTIKPFYEALRSCGLNKTLSVVITIGGTLGYLIKYPYLAYKKWQYRKYDGEVTDYKIEV